MSLPGATRLGLRVRLLGSVMVTIGIVLAGLTAGFNLILADRLNSDANSVLAARAAAELAAVRVAAGHVRLPETPDQGSPDTTAWVFQGSRPIEQPQSPPVGVDQAAAVAILAPARRDLAEGQVRLYALPVDSAGRQVGAVVAAISLGPYSQARQTALIASILLALLAFIAVALSANWLIRRSLAPISRMTGLAAKWSEHDIDRRFAQGPPHDEFTQLAFTLDGLLDRLAGSLRHEQRLSAELSHELRTPLANVAAQAQYALRHTEPTPEGHEALHNILTSANQMTNALDTLIAAARGDLDPRGATSNPAVGAQASARACSALSADRDIKITVDDPEQPVRVAVEQHLVERILIPLVENACRHASTQIRIRVEAAPTAVHIIVEDDGDGIADDALERIFEPGWQGSPSNGAVAQKLGAGLGLPLARRLARTARGDVRVDPTPSGARFEVALPRA